MAGRILVTGATGFLGGAVLRRLGAQAIGQGRNPARLAALAEAGFRTVAWTLPDPAPALPDDITAIVHCAALSAPFGAPAAFRSANVEGTRAVLDLARANRIRRVVHISSPSIYFALADRLNIVENAPLPRPFNAYAASKRAAEELVRASAGPETVILRPRGLYGPGDTSLLPRLLRTARQRALPLFREGRARIDLTYVEDVVDAVMAALEAGPGAVGKAYNISGGEVLSIQHIVTQTCASAGLAPRWRRMPLPPALLAASLAERLALLRPGQPEPPVTRYALGLFAFAQSLDISRAKADLGWTPKVSFADGLARTFAAGPPP